MKHAIALMLETDTIEHLDWVAGQLGYQRKREVSRSETVDYLAKRHWIRLQKRVVEQRAAKSERKIALRDGLDSHR